MRGPEAGDASGPSFPEGLLDELALRGRVYPPEGTFPGLLLRPRHFDEVTVQRQVVTDRVLHRTKSTKMITGVPEASPGRAAGGGGAHLPALVCSPVVRVVLCDVIVDSVQCELLVGGQRDGLDDQLCIGVRRLGVILRSGAHIHVTLLQTRL